MASNTPTIKSKTKRLYVAAIDFGTTYSGYAFSPKATWQAVIVYNKWNSGKFESHKTPTALLLNPDKSFHSFGYEAESNYAALAEVDSDDDDEEEKSKPDCSRYYFFHRFKMILHENHRLSRNSIIHDETGKPLEAMTVFKLSIKHLLDELMKTLNTQMANSVFMKDVDFVLTVPAIWGDASKMFMREAAIYAGIPTDQLTIALEPEAASIYCQYLHFEKDDKDRTDEFLKDVSTNTKYMVLDLGGGTVDITVHQKSSDGTLQEILPATGGPLGGTTIDKKFISLIEEIAGKGICEELKQESMEDYIDFFRQFEIKKRNEATTKVRVTIPLSLDRIVKKKTKGGISKLLESMSIKTDVSYDSSSKKLILSPEFFNNLFKDTTEGILQHIDTIFKSKNLDDVNTIIMVGGFSECKIIQKALQSKYKNTKRLIIPDEAGLAVVKGAVYFGHIPDVISRRVSRYTYGIQSWPEFCPGKDPEEKKIKVNNSFRCKDVMFPVIRRGEQIKVGHRKSQVFQALKPNPPELECAIFVSDREDPRFVDEEGCRQLGILKVPIPPGTSCAEIEETIIFGETEIHFTANQLGSGRIMTTKFDMLDPKNIPDP
ncbi:heat shock 70 kDa protein 12A-like [Saccostrea cucullata]|uniref:heat shock 70 kDa protein 12A-like n=1 Tax=Saccostrea cuccullata TaxID=36930 RepID=UPI002ED1D5D4